MITIEIHPNEFTVNGHAEYAEQGKDIVCAAVSSSAQVVAHILQQVAGARVIAHKAFLNVKIERTSIYTKFVMKSFVEQMKDIEEQYKENVKVEMHIG